MLPCELGHVLGGVGIAVDSVGGAIQLKMGRSPVSFWTAPCARYRALLFKRGVRKMRDNTYKLLEFSRNRKGLWWRQNRSPELFGWAEVRRVEELDLELDLDERCWGSNERSERFCLMSTDWRGWGLGIWLNRPIWLGFGSVWCASWSSSEGRR